MYTFRSGPAVFGSPRPETVVCSCLPIPFYGSHVRTLVVFPNTTNNTKIRTKFGTSETNTESLLSKFYLCTVPRHHRHQPATHCPKNRFQLLTKLHKEQNKIAAEAAEATTHTKKKNDDNDDDDNDEGGRTKTKEEGRRTKDECRRTRTNTQFLVTSSVCLPFLVSPLLFLEAWTIGCSKSLCVFV